MAHHTSAARKVLKARADQHQVIVGSGAAPSLADNAMLTAPYGASLTDTMTTARGEHTRLMMVLVILLGQDPPTMLDRRDIIAELLERETGLEEYKPRDQGLKACLPA